MKTVNIKNIEIKGKSLVVKDYYNQVADNKTEDVIGILNELPKGKVIDIWCADYKRPCLNWFEFMYNNPYAPNVDSKYKYGRGIVACSYVDGSSANKQKNIGSMKNIWKDFEDKYLKDLDFNDLDIKSIERLFWNYYITNYGDKFNVGVSVLEDYILRKRELMTEEQKTKEREAYPFLDNDDLWKRGCRDYLEYLIRVKTVRGFIIELVLFKALESLSGGEFIESDAENEKKGIDGFIVLNGSKFPVSLKPNTFGGGISPVYKNRLVKYKKLNNDLYFTFTTGEDLLRAVQQVCGL